MSQEAVSLAVDRSRVGGSETGHQFPLSSERMRLLFGTWRTFRPGVYTGNVSSGTWGKEEELAQEPKFIHLPLWWAQGFLVTAWTTGGDNCVGIV